MQAPAREYSPAVVIPPSPPNLSTAVHRCIDYLPFGETIPAGAGNRPACYGGSLQPVFQNSFAPPPPNVIATLYSGAMLGPWLVGGSGIDHIGPYWQSADGDQSSIDLNGPGPGSITTSLSTLNGWTSGATYRVSFSLAANPDNTLSPQSCVRVTTSSSQQDYCFNVLNVDGQGTPASSANMGWQRHTFEFTGAPTDHLTFTSLDAPGDAWGPALDNITVEKLVPTTGPGVRHLFTGKERDGETGLDFFGARYMSAAQGRFTSADAPFADQIPADPQSWNLYAYARNNPLRYVDRDGRCVSGVDTIVCLAVAWAATELAEGVWKVKASMDELQLVADNHAAAMDNLAKACLDGGGDCSAAIETAARTSQNLRSRAMNTIGGAMMFPGTFFGGFPPTSKQDLISSALHTHLVEREVARARNMASEKQKQEQKRVQRQEEDRKAKEAEERRRIEEKERLRNQKEKEGKS